MWWLIILAECVKGGYDDGDGDSDRSKVIQTIEEEKKLIIGNRAYDSSQVSPRGQQK